jgi:hypothetical protein
MSTLQDLWQAYQDAVDNESKLRYEWLMSDSEDFTVLEEAEVKKYVAFTAYEKALKKRGLKQDEAK